MTTKKGRRGGRQPGRWTLIKPEELLAWRQRHRVSRLTLAKAVGVSSTSVQNWETGHAVATPRAQAQLVEVMRSDVSTLLARKPDERAELDRAAIEGTAAIVSAAIGANLVPTESAVIAFIGQVRKALRK